MLDTKEYPLDNRKIAIFDNVINEPTATQMTISNHYTGGRMMSLRNAVCKTATDNSERPRHTDATTRNGSGNVARC